MRTHRVAARDRIVEKVGEAQRLGISGGALVWVERVIRNYELAAVDYGVALVATASSLATAEAVLRSSIEAKDALWRRIRELENRIRVLEAQVAAGRRHVVVPFARRPRLRRVDKTMQVRR